jgi:hypothetical protein
MTTPDTPVVPAHLRRIVCCLTIGLLALGGPKHVNGQGCVPIHGSGIPTADAVDAASDAEYKWDLSFDYRNFNSIHDFIGTTENARIGTGVFNKSNFTDSGLTYNLDPRWSVSLTVPFSVEDRSQETNGLRYHTDTAGIGDIQLEGHFLVFDPKNHPKGNISIGLGLVMPTGSDDTMGTFLTYNKTTNTYTAKIEPVDQSIQLGTGGWGVIMDLYAYHEIVVPAVTGFVSASYTAYPDAGTNGVPTYRSNPYEALTGIPDSYLYRIGAEWAVLPKYGISLSLAERMEGVPVYNLIGGTEGFRRPGYTIACESGIIWTHQTWTVRFYMPASQYHNRTQSLADKEDSILTGKYQHGDAFFANYEWILSLDKRF